MQCHTCPAELPELNRVHFVGYPLTMCFQCSMILLHLGGAGPGSGFTFLWICSRGCGTWS